MKKSVKKVWIKYWVTKDDRNCSLIYNNEKLKNKGIEHLKIQFEEFNGEGRVIELEVDDKKFSGGYFHHITYKGITHTSWDTTKFMRMIVSLHRIYGKDFEKHVFA